MKPISKILIMLLLAGTSAPGLAQEPSYTVLDPKAYQSFVANWTPSNKPLCAAIQSQADWDAVFHPAPVMGANRPFGPPAEFWNDRAVLVLAKVIDNGDTAKVFQLTGVHRDEKIIEVDYSFRLNSARLVSDQVVARRGCCEAASADCALHGRWPRGLRRRAGDARLASAAPGEGMTRICSAAITPHTRIGIST